jgi:hypothetical protein
MVIATGLPFETVAGFTRAQFEVAQEATRRYWEMMASVNGIQSMFGGKRSSPEQSATEALEAKVTALKKVTGKKSFDLYEVI